MPDIVGNGDDLGDHIATKSLKQIKGTDVSSADSITLQADGNTFDVTGTTTINHVTSTNWVVGSIMILHFDGAVTLTNNAGGLSGAECNILLSGDVDYTTSAGDILTFLLHDSTNWQEISRNSNGVIADASITNAKLVTNPLARSNHTGTQLASTVSDFDTEVSNNSSVTANTAKVSLDDNSVTLAKLAHGTADKYLGFDGSGIPAELTVSGGAISTDSLIQPTNTTIGDYSTPSTSTSSSQASNEPIAGDLTTADSRTTQVHAWNLPVGGQSGANTIPSQIIGLTLKSVTVYAYSENSSTSGLTLTCNIINGGSTTYTFSQTVSSFTANDGRAGNLIPALTFTDSSPSYVLQSGDKLKITGSGGLGLHWNGTGSAPTYTNPHYSYVTSNAETFPPSNVRDNDTTTTTKTTSEVNPNISVGFSSKIISQIAVWYDVDSTETEIQIQTSPDNSVWTTRRTITTSNLTSGQYNYIKLNNITTAYIRIRGSSGNSKILSLNEIKTFTPSSDEMILNHGHSVLSSTDTSLTLSGE